MDQNGGHLCATWSFRTPAGGQLYHVQHVTSISGSVTADLPASSKGGLDSKQLSVKKKKKRKEKDLEVAYIPSAYISLAKS